MVKDNIANLIVKLKNASTARQVSTNIPFSKLSESILTLLAREGYIKSFERKGKEALGIEVVIAYEAEGEPKIQGAERVSKLSKRTYSGAKNLRSVRSGYGMLVLTTPKGILSDKEAKKMNIGGEVMFKIW